MQAFQHQESAQTLGEALEEYYGNHPELLRQPTMTLEAQTFFGCHDAAHVVYGCGTTLDDEAAVKIASLFGTTGGMAILRGYRLQESRTIYRQLRTPDVLRAMAHSVVVVPRMLLRCLRQRRRWPWDGYREYLGVPLRDLRREFGIRVVHYVPAEGR